MSHTNSTTNYNLPQFIGTDKPTWLNDVNGAFASIDTQMKANADSATSAGTSATTANNAIGTLSNLNTTTKTDLVSAVNEVNTNLGVVSGVVSQASTDATQAKNGLEGLERYLTLTNFATQTVTSTNATINASSVRTASNADGSYGKFYGYIIFTPTNASTWSVRITSPFRPTSKITINGVNQALVVDNGNIVNGQFIDVTVDTDGTIEIPVINAGYLYNKLVRLALPPCIYSFVDFGDTANN